MARMHFLIAALLLVSFLATAAVYDRLPFQLMTHWDFEGNPDGWMLKPFAAWLLPSLSVALAALLLFLPRLDPLRKNIESFSGRYQVFIAAFLVFMLLLHLHVLLNNLGAPLPVRIVMPLLISGLFAAIGWLLPHTRRNYFIGIRTPWALHSDEVWARTHKAGGRLFLAAAAVCAAGALFQELAFQLVLAAALGAAVLSIMVSFLAYRQLSAESGTRRR